MGKALRLTLATAAVGAAVGCAPGAQREGQTQSVDKEQMITAARALDQRFLEAFNASDVDAVMACYWHSPNLAFFPPGTMDVHGWEATKTDFAEDFAAMPGATLELTDRNYEVLGDAVVSWGTWRMTVPSGSAAPTVIDGRYTEVMAEHDGTWLYMLDHASVPMPLPGQDAGTS